MQHKKLVACTSAVLLAIAVACSKSSNTPVSPSGTQPGSAEAGPNGETLKASAPTPQSPINDAQLDQLSFTAGKATARYNPAAAAEYSYQFEVKNAGGTTVCSATIPGGSGSTVIWTPTNCSLDFDAPHTWRLRATYYDANGPWSSAASFRTPTGGYIRGNEVLDPLTNGKSVGQLIGPVTFIPGVGARLEDFNSYIVYQLPQPLIRGEFSMIVTNVATNTEGDKTKIMCMSQGFDDIITNDRRMTVEKRGDPEGIVAWRFITHGGQIDTEGAERRFVAFDPGQPYLWTATWNGSFRLRIQRGGAAGPVIYDMSKPYQLEYDPNPHIVFAGCPTGRSGPTAATVPGMVIRNIWVSSNPRPGGIGQ